MKSPIDVSRRRIIYKPAATQFNYKTPPEVIAAWIQEVLDEYPNKNTIVHVTYALSKKLKTFFKGAYVNDKENKGEILEKFKKGGGLWLASGCSEGLNFEYESCELNLIPLLPRPNLEDHIQKRRLAHPNGSRNYDIRVLKTVQQQAGRASRHEDDFSTVVIGDRGFKTLVLRRMSELPKTFTESIVWEGKCRE
jgi:Rad3-related DNA helicase